MSKRGRELQNKFSRLASKKQPDPVYCNRQMYSTGTKLNFQTGSLAVMRCVSQETTDAVCTYMEQQPKGIDAI